MAEDDDDVGSLYFVNHDDDDSEIILFYQILVNFWLFTQNWQFLLAFLNFFYGYLESLVSAGDMLAFDIT